MIAIQDSNDEQDRLEMRLLEMLGAHAIQAGHPFNEQHRSITATEDGVFLGGAQVQTLFGWCFLDLLAVDPKARGKGIGTRLMQTIETRARAEGSIGIWLDTRGFQAKAFYAKLGYDEFARLPGPVPDADKIFMRKFLRGRP